MRITLLVVHRLSASPEAALAKDYAARATAAGRAMGLGPVDIIEVEAKKSGKAAEAAVIAPHLEGAYVIVCDEHGASLPSREFAARIANLRDGGERRLVIVIGGADGLDASILSVAKLKIAFGAQTWPHALARVMLAEQVYRAVTILGGSPYHRD